jgi:hypothetical protein
MRIIALFFICFTANAVTLTTDYKVSGLCGSYASPILTDIGLYDIYTNATPGKNDPCPGYGCPGIVRYSGTLHNQVYQGIVAPNELITDIDSQWKMFSRPIIKEHNGEYYAVSAVLDNYSNLHEGTASFLTSPDGINWTYHGKLKGEPFGFTGLVSGMALVINDTPPKFRYYSDGFGVRLAGLYSYDGNYWYFERDESGKIKELNPWVGQAPVFASIEVIDGIYYLTAANHYPPTDQMFAHSLDGINFISDGMVPAKNTEKNMSLFVENDRLFSLTTSGYSNECGRKILQEVAY